MKKLLHARIFGQGPALIILHGLLGTGDNWQTIAKQLAERYTICLPDLRNHGKSFHTDDFNFQLMVQDVLELMDSNWMQSAYFIGHSMGGKVAMHLALSEPDRVDRLLVADIGVKDYPPGHLQIFQALQSINLAQLEDRKTAEMQLLDSLKDKGVVQFLAKNLSRAKDGSFHWKMNLEAIITGYKNIMEGIHTANTFEKPSLFVRGAQSKYILDEDFDEIRKCFPNAQFETLSNAGHWLHADQPAAFLNLAEKFFEDDV